MYSPSNCYICKNISYDESNNKIKVCEICRNKNPFLAEGLQTDWGDQELRDELSVLGNGIGWYAVGGFDSYADFGQNGQEIVWNHIIRDDSPDPSTALTELEAAIRNFGLERSLTYLLIHEIHTEYVTNSNHIPGDESGLPSQMFRFAFGFAMSLSGDFDSSSLENPAEVAVSKFPREYQEIVQALHKIMGAFGSMDFLREEVGVNTDKEPFERIQVAQSVQNRELIVSRMAFYGQYLDSMERLYTPFQVELFKHHNIDIVDSVHWARNLVDQMETIYQEIITGIARYQNSCLRVVGGYKRAIAKNHIQNAEEYIETDEYRRLRQNAAANWNLLVQIIRTKLWLTKEDIQSASNAPDTGYFNRYFEKITTEVGSASLKSPYKHNKMDEAPLIGLNGYYLLPHLPQLTYALSQRFYYLLTKNKSEFKRNLGDTWGDVIELWITNRLSQILSDDQFAHSVEYEHPDIDDGEIDILANINNKLLIIEIKSKRLRAKSRVGAIEEIESDVSKNKGIGKAVKQVENAIYALEDVGSVTKIDEVPFEINPDTIQGYETMVVTSTHYDELATRMFPILFESYEADELPYVCSAYDVDAMAEVLNDDELIEYVSLRRKELFKQRAFAAGDEVDFLEAFKANVLGESAYSFPSKEEANHFNVQFMRSIFNIDAGVRTTVGERYGMTYRYPTDIY